MAGKLFCEDHFKVGKINYIDLVGHSDEVNRYFTDPVFFFSALWGPLFKTNLWLMWISHQGHGNSVWFYLHIKKDCWSNIIHLHMLHLEITHTKCSIWPGLVVYCSLIVWPFTPWLWVGPPSLWKLLPPSLFLLRHMLSKSGGGTVLLGLRE